MNISKPTEVVAQTVKDLPAMWETWVQSLVWEDPLEKGMATHSSVLTWRLPWVKEPGRQSMRLQRVRHDWGTQHSTLNVKRVNFMIYILFLNFNACQVLEFSNYVQIPSILFSYIYINVAKKLIWIPLYERCGVLHFKVYSFRYSCCLWPFLSVSLFSFVSLILAVGLSCRRLRTPPHYRYRAVTPLFQGTLLWPVVMTTASTPSQQCLRK